VVAADLTTRGDRGDPRRSPHVDYRARPDGRPTIGRAARHV